VRSNCFFAWALVLALFAGPVRADQPVSAYLSLKGVNIHYIVQGSGSPVVLVHGWQSSAQLNWQAPGILAALARKHRVIALDLPGYGRSDRPAAADAYGAQWIEDVLGLLDHLAVRQAHIVGYSMGGMVALKFTADHPDRVMSVALGGMGLLRRGGGMQQAWTFMPDTASRGVAELALTPEQVKSVRAPVEIVVGSNDPVRRLYIGPLLEVRRDWPVVEIADADHLTCLFKAQFIDELARWLAIGR
jgi:pimeloyl-ACP methyl ester carboxylesterase